MNCILSYLPSLTRHYICKIYPSYYTFQSLFCITVHLYAVWICQSLSVLLSVDIWVVPRPWLLPIMLRSAFSYMGFGAHVNEVMLDIYLAEELLGHKDRNHGSYFNRI